MVLQDYAQSIKYKPSENCINFAEINNIKFLIIKKVFHWFFERVVFFIAIIIDFFPLLVNLIYMVLQANPLKWVYHVKVSQTSPLLWHWRFFANNYNFFCMPEGYNAKIHASFLTTKRPLRIHNKKTQIPKVILYSKIGFKRLL